MLTSNSASPLLQLRDLRVSFSRFAGTAPVLNGISMHVDKSEKVGLVGESGCGKSLTVKTIMGLLPKRRVQIPSGSIEFMSVNLLPMSRQERRRSVGREMVMVFQDPMTSLNPVFTVGQQMEEILWWNLYRTDRPWAFFGRRVVRRERRRAVRDILRRTLQEVRLSDPDRVLDSYPFQLSGGMRQRILIAMALASSPSLLLADEPGTALDVTTQKQTISLLNDLVVEKELAILMITHNLGLVRETTDRIYIMYAGTIVEHAGTQDVFAAPAHPYTQGLLDSVPKLTEAGIGEGIPGTVPDYLNVNPGCRFFERCRHAMAHCEHRPPPLTEIGEAGSGHFVACFLYTDEPARQKGADSRG